MPRWRLPRWLAVPLTTMVAAEVETMVSAGERICSEGGVVSPLPPPDGCVGCAGCVGGVG